MRNLPEYYYNAPEKTFELAKLLRKDMTATEKLMWQVLRRNSLKGYYFRRQHPIAWYVADFYCHDAKLVVELDGEVHDFEDIKRHDAERDELMRGLGITVLRFKNEDVRGNVDEVVREIERHLP